MIGARLIRFLPTEKCRILRRHCTCKNDKHTKKGRVDPVCRQDSFVSHRHTRPFFRHTHKERARMTMRNKAVLAAFGILLMAATLSAQAVQPPPAPWRGGRPTPRVGSHRGGVQIAPSSQMIPRSGSRLFGSQNRPKLTEQV